MLNDMKISSRLTMLLAILLAGLVMVGGMGLYTAGKINSALESAFEEKMTPMAQLSDVAEANRSNRLAIANALIQPENMTKYIQEIADNKTVIDKQWEAFMTSLTDEEDRILAAKFVEVRGRFVEEGIKPALAAMRANNAAEIKRIQAQIESLSAPVDEALNALTEMEKRDAEILHEESAASYKSTRMLSIALILIGALLGGALGFSIIRGIKRSMDDLRGVMVKMSADGDLSAPLGTRQGLRAG